MNMIASQPIISCTSSSFSNPNISDASVLSLSAFLVQNYTASSPPFYNPNHGTITPVTLDFCNVTITHTHPGANDIVETQIWLPTSTWNERLQVVGGGGYIAGLFGYMFVAMDGALAEGYATASTNAGIYATDINGGDAHEWALLPNGSINLPLIKNFAYVSLGDMSVIAKSIVKSYYGSKEKYSYFSGCSNGGRQGYQLAQRYPKAFDGIAACAPGIYWDEWVENFWAQQLMSSEASYPHGCELDALHQAAVEACDELGDGVKDGIMSEPDLCDFDPYLMVGKSVECPDAGHNVKVSKIAAQIAQSVWKNQRQPGINFQGQPAGYDVDLKYAGGTTCSPNSTCIGNPDLLTLNYIRAFVKKDTSWDPSGMTREELENLRAQSVREYKDILGITSYELSAFRDNGGKMITYQGTSDPAVSYKNTRRFYDAVNKQDHSIHEYYRLFLAPGLGHGVGGKGAYPNTTFHALVDWVERDKAPESLQATSAPDETGATINRILCAYPKKVKYDGEGDVNAFGSYKCVK